jgi:hypothetical protein
VLDADRPIGAVDHHQAADAESARVRRGAAMVCRSFGGSRFGRRAFRRFPEQRPPEEQPATWFVPKSFLEQEFLAGLSETSAGRFSYLVR